MLRQLWKLDDFDFLLLDDLSQRGEKSEALFTLIAERYERRSLGITSNLFFSGWERIFANPMATAAAIDRVVHHSVILEFDVPRYRDDATQQRGQELEVDRQDQLTPGLQESLTGNIGGTEWMPGLCCRCGGDREALVACVDWTIPSQVRRPERTHAGALLAG